MPIFTENENMNVSKESFDLAKQMAVEKYKAGLAAWLKSEMIDNEYSQWDAAIHFVLEHIEASNKEK